MLTLRIALLFIYCVYCHAEPDAKSVNLSTSRNNPRTLGHLGDRRVWFQAAVQHLPLPVRRSLTPLVVKKLLENAKRQKFLANHRADKVTGDIETDSALQKRSSSNEEPILQKQSPHSSFPRNPAQPFKRVRKTTKGVVHRNTPYDVPQIECPPAEDGMDRFACPSPDSLGRYLCLDGYELCDGYKNCPNSEDEDRKGCMFYKMTKAHLNLVADALLKWVRRY